MKKIVSLLLTLVLVLSISSLAMADETVFTATGGEDTQAVEMDADALAKIMAADPASVFISMTVVTTEADQIKGEESDGWGNIQIGWNGEDGWDQTPAAAPEAEEYVLTMTLAEAMANGENENGPFAGTALKLAAYNASYIKDATIVITGEAVPTGSVNAIVVALAAVVAMGAAVVVLKKERI